MLNINTKKALKNIKAIVILCAVTAVSAGVAAQMLVDRNSDLANMTTLVIEVVFGTFIAFVVYIYSKHQQVENQAVTKKIQNALDKITSMEEERARMLTEQREIIAVQLNRNLDLVNRKLIDVRRLDEKYKKSERQSQKQHYVRRISRKAQFALALDLNIEFLDMMRVYGGTVTKLYQEALWLARYVSLVFQSSEDYDEHAEYLNELEELQESCRGLKNGIREHLPKEFAEANNVTHS